MTNREWLFKMSDEDLAIELVQKENFNEYGDARYTCTDGMSYWKIDDAIKHEITWLGKEHGE